MQFETAHHSDGNTLLFVPHDLQVVAEISKQTKLYWMARALTKAVLCKVVIYHVGTTHHATESEQMNMHTNTEVHIQSVLAL